MKKKTTVKDAIQPKGKIELPTDLFEIEIDPPTPSRSSTQEMIEIYDKLDRTLLQLKKGQAFIIPVKKAHSIKKYLANNYPENSFKLFKIKDSKNARIYLLN